MHSFIGFRKSNRKSYSEMNGMVVGFDFRNLNKAMHIRELDTVQIEIDIIILFKVKTGFESNL